MGQNKTSLDKKQVALTKGEKQRGNDGFRGRPSQHWMMVSIQVSVSGSICQFFFAKFILALIVLSSITKKGEIVRNMAPLDHCL